MNNLKNLKNLLLSSPNDRHSPFDPSLKPLVEQWSEPPTALQILHVLDMSIHSSLASGVVVTVLQIAYNATLKSEGKTHEQIVSQATWRF